MRIARARHEDLTPLRELAVATNIDTFGPYNTPENMAVFLKESYSMERLERDLGEKGAVIYLAWLDDKLAGFVRLRINDEASRWLGDNHIELHRLYVHPDHQGKKIGSKLMETALAHASDLGHEWIWLGVWERNFNAQKFYASWGFERFAEHICPVGDDPQIDWLLRKKIRGPGL